MMILQVNIITNLLLSCGQFHSWFIYKRMILWPYFFLLHFLFKYWGNAANKQFMWLVFPLCLSNVQKVILTGLRLQALRGSTEAQQRFELNVRMLTFIITMLRC